MIVTVDTMVSIVLQLQVCIFVAGVPVSVNSPVHARSCMKKLKDVFILAPLEADLIV